MGGRTDCPRARAAHPTLPRVSEKGRMDVFPLDDPPNDQVTTEARLTVIPCGARPLYQLTRVTRFRQVLRLLRSRTRPRAISVRIAGKVSNSLRDFRDIP
jgi:hypothetical protein